MAHPLWGHPLWGHPVLEHPLWGHLRWGHLLAAAHRSGRFGSSFAPKFGSPRICKVVTGWRQPPWLPPPAAPAAHLGCPGRLNGAAARSVARTTLGGLANAYLGEPGRLAVRWTVDEHCALPAAGPETSTHRRYDMLTSEPRPGTFVELLDTDRSVQAADRLARVDSRDRSRWSCAKAERLQKESLLAGFDAASTQRHSHTRPGCSGDSRADRDARTDAHCAPRPRRSRTSSGSVPLSAV